MINVDAMLLEYSRKLEERAKEVVKNSDRDLTLIYDAMSYSLLSGGKRIRPALVLEIGRMLGADEKISLDFALAVELVHTYSLIHDDLPCMDNDDFRRGRPTNHKVYGEAVATLAGDALLTLAFAVLASSGATAGQIAQAVSVLSESAGVLGMIGGQIMDISSEGKSIAYETLVKLHERKTGALISCAARLGCISAMADEKVTRACMEYADKIGLCFQIVDDVLDRIGDFELLGKSTGSDEDNCKSTFLSFMSVDEAMENARALTDEAKDRVGVLPDSHRLIALAEYLLERKK